MHCFSQLIANEWRGIRHVFRALPAEAVMLFVVEYGTENRDVGHI